MAKKIHKPFVFLCTGMSLDGKLSNYKKECSPISSDDNRDMLLDGRVEVDAVMIGASTLRLDDSSLTVKTVERRQKRIASGKAPEPIKVVAVSNADDLDLNGKFFTKGEGRKIIFTTNKTSHERIVEMEQIAHVYIMGKRKVDLERAMEILNTEGVKTLLVEGGGELIASLLEKDLVNEIHLKIGDLILGGRTTATLVDGKGFDLLSMKKVEFLSVKQYPTCIILKAKVVR